MFLDFATPGHFYPDGFLLLLLLVPPGIPGVLRVLPTRGTLLNGIVVCVAHYNFSNVRSLVLTAVALDCFVLPSKRMASPSR